ncbi:MAG: ATP-grasp domain-containing protein [Oscillospiraceae bacterium]|nr:ATP-grasp domain-containing protein [Oscillospiraceae bacterium]
MLLAYGIPHLFPVGIPDEILPHQEWLGRKIVFADSIQKAPLIFSYLRADKLFIKSAGRVKTNFTDIYDRTTPLPITSDPIMFSEKIQIKSEWRAFVFRQRLMDIRCYSGDPWLIPNKSAVMSMIDAVGQKYPAYALDVAVIPTESGFQTVIIEVHNFISCGLYGAVLPLGMYASAYRFELQSWKTRSKAAK